MSQDFSWTQTAAARFPPPPKRREREGEDEQERDGSVRTFPLLRMFVWFSPVVLARSSFSAQ